MSQAVLCPYVPAVRPSPRALAPRVRLQDPLTGLLGRAGLEEAVVGIIDRGDAGRGAALLCVDLGGRAVLAAIEALGGAPAVQAALGAAARRLRGAVRGSDTVARLGGDDFVVLLEGLGDLANAHRVADQVLQALRPLREDYPDLAPRIGVTRLPGSARAAAAMFAARDLELGQA